MDVQSAVVETLTAEVRVLMVGSRQVTLSVARQLDCASFDEIDPFGRVRLGGDFGLADICFIGRHRRTGALVRGAVFAQQPDAARLIAACRQLPLIVLAGLT